MTTSPTSQASQAEATGSPANQTSPGGRTFQPAIDLVETAQEYLIHADVPGATAESIDVQFDDGVLTLRASVPPRNGEPERFRVREYQVGGYERSFRVSPEVDASKIAARFKHGVVTITLPKAEASKPRRIAVESTGDGRQ